MKESELQNLILDWLALHRIFHYRQNTGAMAGLYKGNRWFVRFGRKGAPDIVACYKGRFVGIECKGQKGKQSQEQKNYESDLNAAGGRYILARRLEDVTEVLI